MAGQIGALTTSKTVFSLSSALNQKALVSGYVWHSYGVDWDSCSTVVSAFGFFFFSDRVSIAVFGSGETSRVPSVRGSTVSSRVRYYRVVRTQLFGEAGLTSGFLSFDESSPRFDLVSLVRRAEREDLLTFFETLSALASFFDSFVSRALFFFV